MKYEYFSLEYFSLNKVQNKKVQSFIESKHSIILFIKKIKLKLN
jgi:hypothetical protein